jgi:hypothetical protein
VAGASLLSNEREDDLDRMNAKTTLIAMAVLASSSMTACGGSETHGHSSTAGPATASGSTSGAGGGASALSAEAQSLATGDIPDNQVFLTFRDPQSGYALRYPEGWAQRGIPSGVTFADKNNLIRLTLSGGAPPTMASVLAELSRERREQSTLSYGSPSSTTIAGATVVKVSYTTLSPPNAVTGKRVRLLVDRYVFAHTGRVATLDLGTPSGIDNVDAYRMIAHSFHWL